MGRQSGDADKKMLTIGKEIARSHGCTAIRVRDIVEKADVNLGMFHYYFKSRERFIQLLLKEVYGEFFEQLLFVTEEGAKPLVQLQEILTLLGLFMYENRSIAVSFLKDILSGDKEVLKYGRRKPAPHIEIIIELLAQCKKDKSLKIADFQQAMPLFFGAVAQPILFDEIATIMKKDVSHFDLTKAMSRKGIEERVQIVLRGLGADL